MFKKKQLTTQMTSPQMSSIGYNFRQPKIMMVGMYIINAQDTLQSLLAHIAQNCEGFPNS